jgi:hypothetical protein
VTFVSHKKWTCQVVDFKHEDPSHREIERERDELEHSPRERNRSLEGERAGQGWYIHIRLITRSNLIHGNNAPVMLGATRSPNKCYYYQVFVC